MAKAYLLLGANTSIQKIKIKYIYIYIYIVLQVHTNPMLQLRLCPEAGMLMAPIEGLQVNVVLF